MELIITSQIRGENFWELPRKYWISFQTKQWQTDLIDNNIHPKIQTYLSASSEQKSENVKCVRNIGWCTFTQLFSQPKVYLAKQLNEWLLIVVRLASEMWNILFLHSRWSVSISVRNVLAHIPTPMWMGDGNGRLTPLQFQYCC